MIGPRAANVSDALHPGVQPTGSATLAYIAIDEIPLVRSVVALYLLIVEMRLIGLLFYDNQAELAWFKR